MRFPSPPMPSSLSPGGLRDSSAKFLGWCLAPGRESRITVGSSNVVKAIASCEGQSTQRKPLAEILSLAAFVPTKGQAASSGAEPPIFRDQE